MMNVFNKIYNVFPKWKKCNKSIGMKARMRRLAWILFIGMLLLIVDYNVFAADAGARLESLRQISAGYGIVETISVVMGIGLFVSGISRLKRYGEMRGNQMGMQQTITGPLLSVIAGVMLFSLPNILSILGVSFWGSATPLSEDAGSIAVKLKPIIYLVRLIGLVTIIRGIAQLSKFTSEGGGQGVLGKSLMQVFIGLCLVHIIATASVISSITGGLI